MGLTAEPAKVESKHEPDVEHWVQVACAAHEVKNSLAVLRGMATYAAAGRLGMLTPEDETALAQLLASVGQVLAVTQELMEAAEQQTTAAVPHGEKLEAAQQKPDRADQGEDKPT